MFEHLLQPEFDDVYEAPPDKVLDAALRTKEWLDAQDKAAPVTPTPKEQDRARKAFAGAVTNAPKKEQTQNVLALRTPAAVQHLVSMLGAYDWAFVEQAKELRGYVVAKLLEESNGARANDRLRALELLGKITEVGSFTERVEITRKTDDTTVIEERLKARLAAMLPPVQHVEDAEVKDIAVVKK